MTDKEREDRFIERCRENIGVLNENSELLLRYGFAAGAEELGRAGRIEGIDLQRDRVLAALGAMSAPKQRSAP